MITLCDKSLCSGCGACFAVCPPSAIEMITDEKGFLHPKVILGKCVGCGICEKSCPVMSPKKAESLKKAVGAYNINEKNRKESSSGGVFTLLAQKVIEQGGIVYGAAFDETFRKVRHIGVEDMEGISALRGSKYVQSTAYPVFADIKNHLKSGRKVLFCGTPCQVEGLRGYLAKRYHDLLCVDMICHGVPSPKVWEKYISAQEKKAGAAAISVSFTDKTNGWANRSMKLCFENGVVMTTPHSKDNFMKAFSANISLRESCGNCVAKKIDRLSDITIADFWGVNRLSPELYDGDGTSLLIIHTEKGDKAVNAIGEKVKIADADLSAALKINSAATESAKLHKDREEFFASLEHTGFDETVCRLVKQKKSIKTVVKAILSKIKG